MDNNIHNCWRDLRFRYTPDNNEINDITDGRRRSSLQSLARRYRWFSNMALFMILWPIITWANPSIVIPHKTVILIVMCVYFAVCSIMDHWLYCGIKSIDCATMTVSEVARLARLYRRRHLQFIGLLLPIAIGVIGVIIYFSTNIYTTVGVIMGAILGIVIGLRQLMAFLADYRQLMQDD